MSDEIHCPRCRDTGVMHYLRGQGAPWAEYVPVRDNPPCNDCDMAQPKARITKADPLWPSIEDVREAFNLQRGQLPPETFRPQCMNQPVPVPRRIGILVAETRNIGINYARIDLGWRQVGQSQFEARDGTVVDVLPNDDGVLRGLPRQTLVYLGPCWFRRSDAGLIDSLLRNGTLKRARDEGKGGRQG